MRTGLSVVGMNLATGLHAPEENAPANEHPTETSGLSDGSLELTNDGSAPNRTTFPELGGFESQLSATLSAVPLQWGGAAEVAGHTQSAVDAGLSGPDGASVAQTPSASHWQSA